MKLKIRILCCFGLLTFGAAWSPSSFGQTGIWRGLSQDVNTGTFEWVDSDNWDGLSGAVPQRSNAVQFNNTSSSTTVSFLSTTLTKDAFAQSVSILSGAAGHTFAASGLPTPATLIIGNTGAAATLSNASASNQAFGVSLELDSIASSRSVSNTGAGTMTFNGTVTALGTSSLGISNSSATLGGMFFNGAVSAGATTVTNSGVGNVNFGAGGVTATSVTVTNSAAGNVNFNGVVNRGAGALNVTNNGSGVVSFNNGVNGTGSVSIGGSGIVRLGDAAADVVAGGVTVGGASGGRADGLGTVNGALTISTGTAGHTGIYSPGIGQIGTQVVGATVAAGGTALTANAGATFEFDLNSTSSDVVNLSGRNLNLAGAGSEITVRLNLLSAITPPVGVPGTISWDVFTNVGNALSLDLSKLTVDSVVGNLTGTAFRTDQFFWSVTGASSNTLTLSAVPEPSSMALVGLVGIGAAGFARRRMKKATKKEVA